MSHEERMNIKMTYTMMSKKRRTAILLFYFIFSLFISLLSVTQNVSAGSLPGSIEGYILQPDGVTQAQSGTYFMVNDTTSGSFVDGYTGKLGPSNPGWYGATFIGNNGDTVVITAYNLTAQGSTSITLNGVMYNVNVMLNESRDNEVPQIISNPVLNISEDAAYSYDVEVYDPMDSHTFLLTVYPEEMTIGSTNGLIQWNPSNSDVGQHSVTLIVNDTFGATDNQSYTMNVTPVNDAPSITSSAVTDAVEDGQYTYDVDASDADNDNNVAYDDDTLVYSLMTSPGGMIIDPNTGVISWTPGNDDVGDNDVVAVASDGELTDSQIFTITVQNANDAPVITSSPVTSGSTGNLYTYDVAATDNDDDTLTFSMITYPAGMSVNASSGLIEWMPSTEGLFNVTVNVSDGYLTDGQSYTINVTNTNEAPTITSAAVTSAEEDALYTYDVDATDPNNDTLTYALDTSPSGMTIDPDSGLIQWNPTNDSIGENSVVVSASDSEFIALQSFSVIVSNVNDAPSIVSEAVTNATEDVLYIYDVDVFDEDGDDLVFSLTNPPPGMIIGSASGIITWTPDNNDTGLNSITVSVTDGTASDTQLFTVNVSPSNDAPYITSSPITSAYVSRDYSYTVEGSDPDNQNNVDYDDDVLSYALTTYPVGMTISSSGIISWTPLETQLGSNNVVVRIADSEEASIQSFTITVSLYPETISSANSGGSGGRSASKIPDTTIETIYAEAYQQASLEYLTEIERMYAEQGSSIGIDDNEVPVTEFVLSSKTDLEQGGEGIKVYGLSSRPAAISSPTGSSKVYKYMKFDRGDIPDEIIENSVVKFKVSKAWLDNEPAGKDHVVLMRFAETNWQNLPTYFDSSDETHYHYKAMTPGFSYFAIAIKESLKAITGAGDDAESEKTGADGRPLIGPNAEPYSIRMKEYYHISGRFLYSIGDHMVDKRLDFVFRNLNNGYTVQGTTDDGPVPGLFGVSMQGEIGDTIEVQVGEWTERFELKGNERKKFTTTIRTPLEKLIFSKSAIIPLFIVLIILLISIVAVTVVLGKRAYNRGNI